jgi:hypothetical protein
MPEDKAYFAFTNVIFNGICEFDGFIFLLMSFASTPNPRHKLELMDDVNGTIMAKSV